MTDAANEEDWNTRFANHVASYLRESGEYVTGITVIYTAIDDDSHQISAWVVPNEQPVIMTLGHLEWARIRLHQRVANEAGYDDEDATD